MTPTDRDRARALSVYVQPNKRPLVEGEALRQFAAVRSEERAAVLGMLTEADVVEAGRAAIYAEMHARPLLALVDMSRAALAAVAALLEPKGSP